MRFIFVILISMFFVQCSSAPVQTDLEKVFKRIPDSEYLSIVDDNTQGDKKYDGFYNTYETKVTFLNSQMRESLLQREGFFMQWDANQARQQREKTMQEMSNTTSVFISMFTPKAEHNDLAKGGSMWKIFLEVNGLRYEGKARKFEKNMVQTQNLFPFHSRFNKGYMVNFEIPMSTVEKQSAVLILTSSLGTSTFTFKP